MQELVNIFYQGADTLSGIFNIVPQSLDNLSDLISVAAQGADSLSDSISGATQGAQDAAAANPVVPAAEEAVDLVNQNPDAAKAAEQSTPLGSFLSGLSNWVKDFNNFLWGTLFLIPLLVGTGIFYTFRLKFVQVRKFPLAVKYLCGGATLFGERADKKGMSSFQALTTAVAAQVGTGNVAGTATAMVMGGPGSIFWLWCAAFFGMATIFAEAVLAQVYKTYDKEGHVVGGPAYYITRGLGDKAKPLAVFFAIALIIALGFIGNMVQSNTIAVAFHEAYNIPQWLIGAIVCILAFIVFMGGMGRIAGLTEKLVPGMAIMYVLGGTYVLIVYGGFIGRAFSDIINAAFTPQAVFGAGIGVAIQQALRYGVARGLFANEAGMGSTPHAHAVAKVQHPCHQGLVAIFGVATTLVIITFTALVILVSGVFNAGQYFIDPATGQQVMVAVQSGGMETLEAAANFTGIALTQNAYGVVMGNFGAMFVAICLFFFAFSTIVGWYFFGAQNVRYLFGEPGITPYRIFVACFVFLGSFLEVEFVWQLADLFNGLMVIPNLIALWLLNKVVAKHLNEFEDLIAGRIKPEDIKTGEG